MLKSNKHNYQTIINFNFFFITADQIHTCRIPCSKHILAVSDWSNSPLEASAASMLSSLSIPKPQQQVGYGGTGVCECLSGWKCVSEAIVCSNYHSGFMEHDACPPFLTPFSHIHTHFSAWMTAATAGLYTHTAWSFFISERETDRPNGHVWLWILLNVCARNM